MVFSWLPRKLHNSEYHGGDIQPSSLLQLKKEVKHKYLKKFNSLMRYNYRYN